MQHAALQPAGSQVQLDVELAELVLHVGSAQARQDRIVDQPRPAQRVHEIELHLHTDGVLMADKPAAVDHALQRGNAPLEPALHLVSVTYNQGGRFDAVTHGAPPSSHCWTSTHCSAGPPRKVGASCGLSDTSAFDHPSRWALPSSISPAASCDAAERWRGLSAGLRRVDAINIFRVSAGSFTYFRVVSRSRNRRFRRSGHFL